MYDVCYSQAGGKAVSARWVCCGWHERRGRQTRPITGGARGLLLVWVVVAELNGSVSLKFRHMLLNILSSVEWSQPCAINGDSAYSVNLCFKHIYVSWWAEALLFVQTDIDFPAIFVSTSECIYAFSFSCPLAVLPTLLVSVFFNIF